jgi:hypothetical protein
MIGDQEYARTSIRILHTKPPLVFLKLISSIQDENNLHFLNPIDASKPFP